MEVLVKDEEYIQFLIEFEPGDHTTYVDFTVYGVTSWRGDDNSVLEKEHYLKGTVKWDGCSHIYFGDSGYIHLCGKGCFENHNKVMTALWDICSKKIKNWDEKVAC